MTARKVVRIAVPAIRSDGLDISADWPYGEIAPDKLADPITEHRQCAAKQQRHVLCLAEKAAQRTTFDMPHVFGRLGADVNDPLNVGQFVVQNSGIFGTSFRAGSPTFNASGEFVYLHTKPVGGKVDNSYRLALSAERKVTDNIWFTLSFGGEGSRNNSNNKVFVMSSFRWGFTQDPGLTLNQAAKKNP